MVVGVRFVQIVEGFGAGYAMARTQFDAGRKHEPADVGTVGGVVIVTKFWNDQPTFGEGCTQAPSGRPGGPLDLVHGERLDLCVHVAGDINDAVGGLSGAGDPVHPTANDVRCQSGRQVFWVVLVQSGHPPGGFDRLAGDPMVGVLFRGLGGIEGHDDVGSKKAEQEDKSRPEFGDRDGVQEVVLVPKVEDAPDAEDAGDFFSLALVCEDRLADTRRGTALVIVGGLDQVGGIAGLPHQAGDGPGPEE